MDPSYDRLLDEMIKLVSELHATAFVGGNRAADEYIAGGGLLPSGQSVLSYGEPDYGPRQARTHGR